MLFARHNRVHDCGCVCEFYEKIIFSDSFRARILLSTYNISTDQSKDDYHLETAGDYVLNTLLVVSLVCLSVFLSVCLFVCLSSSFFGNG